MKKILALVLVLCLTLAFGLSLAEGAKTYKVGILQLLQHNALDAATLGFKTALTDKLGDAVQFDEQNAQGEPANCKLIAGGFVADEVDLILANATPALEACLASTRTIPVLGTSVTDYATALHDDTIDASVGTGANVSGTSDGVPAQLYADITLELIPDAKKVAVLYCASEVNSVLQAEQFKACMEAKNVEVSIFTFTDSNDINIVCANAIEGVDALYIPTDNTAAANMSIVANVCVPAKMPVICGEENMMGVGGLATVSISYFDIGYLAGEMAYDILVNGADIATMPIGYSTNPVKEYNPDFAAAIGFEVPEGYAPFVAE